MAKSADTKRRRADPWSGLAVSEVAGCRPRPARTSWRVAWAPFSTLSASLFLASCVQPTSAQTQAPSPQVQTHTQLPSQGVPLLLAASVGSAPGAPVDELVLVFAVPLDPMSVSRDRILVIHADGSRSLPQEVTLSPANERDEGDTLRLLGRFGADTPQRVELIAPIYGRDGVSLLGSSAVPSPASVGDRIVDAKIISSSHADASKTSEEDVERERGCATDELVLRLRFSDRLAGLRADALASIAIMGRDGARRSPSAVRDHAAAPALTAMPATIGEADPAAGVSAQAQAHSGPTAAASAGAGQGRRKSAQGRGTSAPDSAATVASSERREVPSFSELDDNVLDLCVPAASEPVSVEISANTFADRHGTPMPFQRVLVFGSTKQAQTRPGVTSEPDPAQPGGESQGGAAPGQAGSAAPSTTR